MLEVAHDALPMQNTSKYIELQESKARRQKKDKKAAKDAEL